jgi:four helix bundle protein
MKQLETLEAWKCAQQLARDAYKLTLKPPLSRHFGMADQIRRAATSTPANIAEGYALGTTAQFIRCLRISLGSTAELLSHLRIASELHLIEKAEADAIINLCERTLRLLIGLLRSLEGRRRAAPFPTPHSPRPPNRESPS